MEEDLGLGNLELIALAAHILQQDGDVQFSPSIDLKKIIITEINFQPDVDLKLALQALAYLAAGHKFAFPARKRRVIDQEVQRDGRLIHVDGWQGLCVWGGTNGLADIAVGDAGDHHNIPRPHTKRPIAFGLNVNPIHSLEREYFINFPGSGLASCFFDINGLAGSHSSVPYSADTQTAEKFVIAEVERLETQRSRSI